MWFNRSRVAFDRPVGLGAFCRCEADIFSCTPQQLNALRLQLGALRIANDKQVDDQGPRKNRIRRGRKQERRLAALIDRTTKARGVSRDSLDTANSIASLAAGALKWDPTQNPCDDQLRAQLDDAILEAKRGIGIEEYFRMALQLYSAAAVLWDGINIEFNPAMSSDKSKVSVFTRMMWELVNAFADQADGLASIKVDALRQQIGDVADSISLRWKQVVEVVDASKAVGEMTKRWDEAFKKDLAVAGWISFALSAGKLLLKGVASALGLLEADLDPAALNAELGASDPLMRPSWGEGPGDFAVQFRLSQSGKYVRLLTSENKVVGEWAAFGDIFGADGLPLPKLELQDLFGLNAVPERYVVMEYPAGSEVRIGTVGPQKGWLNDPKGGGIQIQLLEGQAKVVQAPRDLPR